MMNKETRKLAKIPDEVRAEIRSYFVDAPPIIDEDSKRLPKLDDEKADYVRTGLTVSLSMSFLNVPLYSPHISSSDDVMRFTLQPKWSDLDVNQHVNNVKYIGWILEVHIYLLLFLGSFFPFLTIIFFLT